MKFSTEEAILMLIVLQTILDNLNEEGSSKEISIQTLIDKLNQGEYIRGRLLNLLYTEISTFNFNGTNQQNELLIAVLKKVKFKATPR